MTTTRSLVLIALGCVACGGSVEPTFDVPPAPEPIAALDAAAPETATKTHFVCEINAAAMPILIDCATLADGGPSYMDEGNVDCRNYLAGAGQGCIPPMGCDAWVDGALLPGTCVAQQ